MPFELVPRIHGQIGGPPRTIARQEGPTPEEFIGKVLPAAFRQENVLISAFSSGVWDEFEAEEGFDPFTHELAQSPILQENPGAMVGVASRAELRHVHDQLMKEFRDQQLIADAGGWGVAAGILGAVLSPENLVPMGIAGAAIRNVSAHGVGFIGMKMKKSATIVAAAAGLSEAGLQATQELRHPMVSALSIGAGALLGGAMGTIAGSFGSAHARLVAREVEALMRGPKKLSPQAALIRVADNVASKGDEAQIQVLEQAQGALTTEETLEMFVPDSALIRDKNGILVAVDMDKALPDEAPKPKTFDQNRQSVVDAAYAEEVRAREAAESEGAFDEPLEDFAPEINFQDMMQEGAAARTEYEAQGLNPLLGVAREATARIGRVGRKYFRRPDRDPVSRRSAGERILRARAEGVNLLEQFPMALIIETPTGRQVVADFDAIIHLDVHTNKGEAMGFTLDDILETGAIDLNGRKLEDLSQGELEGAFIHVEGAARKFIAEATPSEAAKVLEVKPNPGDVPRETGLGDPTDLDAMDVKIIDEAMKMEGVGNNPSKKVEALLDQEMQAINNGTARKLTSAEFSRAMMQFNELMAERRPPGQALNSVTMLAEKKILTITALFHRSGDSPIDALKRVIDDEIWVRDNGGIEKLTNAELDYAAHLHNQGKDAVMAAELRQAPKSADLESPEVVEGGRFPDQEPVSDDAADFGRAFEEGPSDPIESPTVTEGGRFPDQTTSEGPSSSKVRLIEAPEVGGGAFDADGSFQVPARILRAITGGTLDDAEKAAAALERQIAGALGIEKLLERFTPQLRVMVGSLSTEARRVYLNAFESGFHFVGDELGDVVPLSAENKVLGWNATLGSLLQEMPQAWAKHRLGRDPGAFDIHKLGIQDAVDRFRGNVDAEKLSYQDFVDRVGKAMRRRDLDTAFGGDPIPEVEHIAKMVREKLFDPTRKTAIDMGFFELKDTEPKTAESYLSRVWNTRKLKALSRQFDEKVAEWLKQQMGAEQIPAEGGPPVPYTHKMAMDDAARIRNKIQSTPAGRSPYDAMRGLEVGPAKALQKRAFAIPDELIEDFLISDIEQITRFYVRTVIPDLELAKAFDGDFTMKNFIGRGDDTNDPDFEGGTIWKEYEKKIAAAESEEDIQKIIDNRDSTLKDILAMRDILRGTYAAPADPDALPVRARIVANRLNYLIQGGTFMISSLPDVARAVMTDGIGRVYGTAIAPMIRDWSHFKLAANEAKLAGVAWDTVLNTRALNIYDLGDDFGRGSKFERFIRRSADQFANFSLLSPWNSAIKQFSGIVVQARIADAILEIDDALLVARRAGGKGSRKPKTAVLIADVDKKTVAKLSQAGIDLKHVKRMARQIRKYSDHRESGLWELKTESWDDMDMVELFRGSLRREVDKIIVTPGVGDRPLWMSTELGRLIGQYRSFSMSATQRVMIPGIQMRDRNMLNGVMLATTIGMVATKIKDDQYGNPGRKDLRYWLAEGVDASGVWGMLANINQDLSSLTRGSVRLGRLVGAPNTDMFTRRNLLSVGLGPTISSLNQLSRVTQDLIPKALGSPQHLTRGDVSALRRLAWANNHFLLDRGFDAAERSTLRFLRSLGAEQ